MITAIVIVLFLAILALDLMPSWKKAGSRENILYCALMLVSFGVIVLYTFQVPIPSPTTPIRDLIDALFPMLNQ